MFVMERLIDLAARRHGFDRVALRRRNLVPPGAMPYTNPFGIVYDSGDYAARPGPRLTLADWAGFEARRAEARRARALPRHRPRQLHRDRHRRAARARADHGAAGGRVDVVIGTLSAGQGHETSFAQLVVEWLGVDARTRCA